jgi:hypothetical protein
VDARSIILLLIAFAVALGFLNGAIKRAARLRRLRALALSDIDNMEGVAFEYYVAELLRHQGYTEVNVSKGSGDFGVDIVASKGTRRYAIQVKRRSGMVSRTAVSDAVAGKGHYSCNAAMVITNSYLSAKSTAFASSVGCEIVDRDTLAEWIVRFQGSRSGSRSSTPPAPLPTTPPAPAPTISPSQLIPSLRPRTMADSKGSPDERLLEALPSTILRDIKKAAASTYPDDFRMQLHFVKRQAAAYQGFQHFNPRGIPEAVLQELRSRAVTDYPSDYVMQLYVIKRAVEAYFALGKLDDENVPVEMLTSIKDKAAHQYPHDFSTQLYIAKKQIESYKALGCLE